jgi:hypothetical protein
VELRQPGHHNVLNALSAVAVGLEVEVGFAHVAGAGNVRRCVPALRAARRGGRRAGGRRLRASSDRDRAGGGGGRAQRRRLVVFPPHRYSRTQALAGSGRVAEAGSCLGARVYGASEAIRWRVRPPGGGQRSTPRTRHVPTCRTPRPWWPGGRRSPVRRPHDPRRRGRVEAGETILDACVPGRQVGADGFVPRQGAAGPRRSAPRRTRNALVRRASLCWV